MIDLHSHTTESDGTLNPAELVALAQEKQLQALAITDHDTFEGFEKALPHATGAGLELLRGIELNSRLARPGERVRWVHVLAYFPNAQVADSFLRWLQSQKDERRDRNHRLASRLQQQGIPVTIEEVEGRGKSLAGRPHFARLLVEKGFARTLDEAFQKYIGEDAPAFVQRQSPSTRELMGIIRAGGGVPVVAHPIRVGLPHGAIERDWLRSLKEDGLLGLEVYHSEQDARLQEYYLALAEELDLAPSGGSDFHGAIKPDIDLGSGRNGNVQVPYAFLTGLRRVGTVHAN